MKRILFSTWYTGLGGGETDLLTLAQSLPSERYTPHLMLPRAGKLSERWQASGWPVHIVPFRGATTLFYPPVWTRLPVVGRIARLLRDQHIDLIHADYHSLPFVAGAAARVGVPLVWTVHGWWFRPWPWQRDFFRALPTVARSHSIRAGFLGKPPFMPPERIPVIYSGIDTQRFQPGDGSALRQALKIAPDAPVVAMIARFQRVKGHDVFQDVARQVALQIPEARFIVAGEDAFGVAADAKLRDATLQAAANDSILRDRLHYIGFRHDVEAVYHAADVVVCASHFESFGIANLEAMACGVPVVSTNAGGPSETVLDGETGYLVPPRDVTTLALYTLLLLRDPALRAQMGQAARRHVAERFSVAAMRAAYERAFERLLTDASSSVSQPPAL
ncbi:glycosyltransferase family 4 protein [Aggregatilineales bacterium SYSU G02658]